MDREQKILDLKHRIVGMYGSTLLPVTANIVTLLIHRRDDSPEERERKIEQNKNIVAQREAAYKKKFPEMVFELEKIMDRIKSARLEYGNANFENIRLTGTAAHTVFNMMCDQCGNRVSKLKSYVQFFF